MSVSVFRAGLALALAGIALLALASPALAHQGSPDYLSQVRSIAPATKGLTVDVLNRDDRLEIQNTSGRTVIVQGYGNDPDLRIGGDGAVAVNTRSPAYYLNNDRYANVKAAPRPSPKSSSRRPGSRFVRRARCAPSMNASALVAAPRSPPSRPHASSCSIIAACVRCPSPRPDRSSSTTKAVAVGLRCCMDRPDHDR